MKILKNQGFTLIELLVVIAIIGILASVVLASLSSARVKARNSSYEAQISEYEKALELYYSEVGTYPTSFGSATACLGTGYAGGSCDNWGGATVYLERAGLNNAIAPYLPSLPIPGFVDTSLPREGAIYTTLNTGDNYRIWYILEGNTNCSNGTIAGASAARTVCRIDK